MQKYGFVYIWYDKKRKMYYIGCHWGKEDDGYICSSNRMRKAYRRRPQDFKRRILKRIYTDRNNLLEEEHKWLHLIKDKELNKKYYNLTKYLNGHWTTDENKKLSIKEKISIKTKEAMNRPDIRKKMKLIWESNRSRVQSEEEKQKRADSNRGQKRTEETKINISLSLIGKKRGPLKEETKQKLSEALKGKNNPFYGKTHSKETIAIIAKKNSEYFKGKKPKNLDWLNSSFWWNNGSINKRSHTCPGKGWTRGRAKKVKP